MRGSVQITWPDGHGAGRCPLFDDVVFPNTFWTGSSGFDPCLIVPRPPEPWKLAHDDGTVESVRGEEISCIASLRSRSIGLHPGPSLHMHQGPLRCLSARLGTAISSEMRVRGLLGKRVSIRALSASLLDIVKAVADLVHDPSIGHDL